MSKFLRKTDMKSSSFYMVVKKRRKRGKKSCPAKGEIIKSMSHSSFYDPILIPPLFLFRCHRDVFAGHIRIHS